VPGDDFFVEDIAADSERPAPGATLRLTFAAASPAQITEGIEKLGATVRSLLSTK